jgi:hypothetical protein
VRAVPKPTQTKRSDARLIDDMARRLAAVEARTFSRIGPATPWALGIVGAPQILETNSSAYSPGVSANVDTDFVQVGVAVNVARLYKVYLHTQATHAGSNTAAGWRGRFTVDGALTARLWREQVIANGESFLRTHVCPWKPATGVYTLRINLLQDAGAGSTLTFAGSSDNPRSFWVEDIGPRP